MKYDLYLFKESQKYNDNTSFVYNDLPISFMSHTDELYHEDSIFDYTDMEETYFDSPNENSKSCPDIEYNLDVITLSLVNDDIPFFFI